MAGYVFMTPDEAWETRVEYRQNYYRRKIEATGVLSDEAPIF